MKARSLLLEALRGDNLLGTIKIALVVGTILCLINQSHVILQGEMIYSDYYRLALNYLVPFSVATYSKLQFCKTRK